MSRRIRAVRTEWKGSTSIFLDTTVAVELIHQLLEDGKQNESVDDWRTDERDGQTVDVILEKTAVDRFLGILTSDPDDMWSAVEDALARIPLDQLPENKRIEPDDEDLAAMLGNWRKNTNAWLETIDDDGQLVLRLDYF